MNILKLCQRLFLSLRARFFPSDKMKQKMKWDSDYGDEELRQQYDLSRDSIVLDVGGYKGQWASDIYSRYRCTIHVFEPVSDFASEIAKRFASNPAITVHGVGLGSESREERISISADGSSIFRKDGIAESIELVDICAWLDHAGIQTVDLIKINIEGGEYELLDRLVETGRIHQMKNIQVQFHDIHRDSEARMAAIQTSLQKTHVLTYQYKFIWENWRLQKD